MTTTPTPRTDAATIPNSDLSDWGTGDSPYVSVDFARQLERELAAARQDYRIWQQEKESLAQQLAAKERELEDVTDNLCLIGDMAVVDWDNETVGKVDAIPAPKPSKTYADKVRNLYKRAQEAEQLEINRTTLQSVAKELARQLEFHASGELVRNIALNTYNNLPPSVRGEKE